MPQLEVRDLSVEIGGHRILSDVSLTVPPRTVVGLLGANGAGKSTTIDGIIGYQKTVAGTISIDGRAVDRFGAARRARAGITRTFQDYLLFEDLTVEENLLCAAEIGVRKILARDLFRFGRPSAAALETVERVIETHGLARYRTSRVEQLSLGWHARVNLARAAAQSPRVLLLDEPAAALSLDARHAVVDTITTLRDHDGLPILLVEHNLDVIGAVCDLVYILEDGKVVASGPTTEVLDSDEVRAIYFGEQPDDVELETAGVPV
ncbi:ABC transporter ATP-binding protein [Gordonia lacunae]|uniref:ABC transporter ATP-binding protein n=1 Tax=Gordonia lacunae TaxID=417102 RepID=A0A2C9ZJ03_9ACTN|nr:ATP-binding cassette domain-containing protein [Gordonia lacunae]OUC77973.1 ABC transporter ATP-binding protein [Gordonia lacunae]